MHLAQEEMKKDVQMPVQQNGHQHNQGMNLDNSGMPDYDQALVRPPVTGTIQRRNNSSINSHRISDELEPRAPLFRICHPIILAGTKCYTDATITIDQGSQGPRKAGVGIFFTNKEQGQKITVYVTAIMQKS